MTVKKYGKTYSVNPLYLIHRYMNGYFDEISENKYLMLVPNYESKEKIKKHEKLCRKIRNLIRLITKNSDDYDYDKNI